MLVPHCRDIFTIIEISLQFYNKLIEAGREFYNGFLIIPVYAWGGGQICVYIKSGCSFQQIYIDKLS